MEGGEWFRGCLAGSDGHIGETLQLLPEGADPWVILAGGGEAGRRQAGAPTGGSVTSTW